jgi:signal transduction histidine kinase
VSRLTLGSAVSTQLVVDGLPPLPAAAEVAVYRIVCEAVTNVVHHVGAGRCTVTLVHGADAVEVMVADDGAAAGPDAAGGHGLTTMRERAEELGGTFAIERAFGTTVRARIPWAGSPR